MNNIAPVPFVLREFQNEDIGYILDCIVRGARFPSYRAMKISVFEYRYKPLILDLIRRANIIVASLPNNDRDVAGFIISEQLVYDSVVLPVLHWIQVRKPFQKQGLGKLLINAAIPSFGKKPTTISHIQTRGIDQDHPPFKETREHFMLNYDPFILFKGNL